MWNILILTLVNFLSQIQAQCVDENGHYVDWVAMYKFPKNPEGKQNSAQNQIDEGNFFKVQDEF